MTSSLRRKHPTIAPITRAAIRHSVADVSRAILITVAVFAAIVGTLAHAAFGQDNPRPSSRRVQRDDPPATLQPQGPVTALPKQEAPAFVVKSSTIDTASGLGQEAQAHNVLQSNSKRYVVNSGNSNPSSATSGGLKWRSPQRRSVTTPTNPSPVAPVAYNQWQSADSAVQQAQASRFTDDDEPLTIPPVDEPDLGQPILPETVPADTDTPPATDPPSALDDLLPPTLPEIGPLPDPDLPPVEPLPDPDGGGLGGGADKPPCKEVYRDTDCCEQTRTCNAALDAVFGRSVGSFPMSFLDITPRYRPDLRETTNDLPDEDDVRQAELAKLAPRDWHNRHGEKIAHGRFAHYQWGRIAIEGEHGTAEIPLTELGSDELCYVGAYWGKGVGLPDHCRIKGQYVVRDFTLTTFHWKASALCHKPLYFEEVQLERYGHSHGPLIQPIISTGHFFVNIALVPYKMGINPPNECQYALGYYRPGSCAPYMIPPVPYSIRGGIYQGLAVGAGIAIFP